MDSIEWPVIKHKHYSLARRCWECNCKTNDRYTVITPIKDHLNLCAKCANQYKTIDKS